jgi:hypothetical protein
VDDDIANMTAGSISAQLVATKEQMKAQTQGEVELFERKWEVRLSPRHRAFLTTHCPQPISPLLLQINLTPTAQGTAATSAFTFVCTQYNILAEVFPSLPTC